MQTKFKPSKRIKAIVAQAKRLKDHYESMADIGTDHGYLPRLMLDKSMVDRCILCDINDDPLKNASSTFNNTVYLDQVTFRLGSGIEPLKHSEVELVVVAGMGGGLILEILSQDVTKTKEVPYFILQPQTEQNILREWLIQHKFNILWEHYLVDMGKHYEILVVETGMNQNNVDLDIIKIDSDDLEFGTSILREEMNAYQHFLDFKMQKYTHILSQMKQAQEVSEKKDFCLLKCQTIEHIKAQLHSLIA